MPRGANLAISQWFRDANSPEQWQEAACTKYQHLPWTHDATPCTRDIVAMQSVCSQCPLTLKCASYALRAHSGGFYAGVWLPWPTPVETDITKLQRHRARRHLKELFNIKRRGR